MLTRLTIWLVTNASVITATEDRIGNVRASLVTFAIGTDRLPFSSVQYDVTICRPVLGGIALGSTSTFPENELCPPVMLTAIVVCGGMVTGSSVVVTRQSLGGQMDRFFSGGGSFKYCMTFVPRIQLGGLAPGS